MKNLMYVILPAIVLLILVAVLAFVGRTLDASLLGENEVPGPGDPDGSGDAIVRLRPAAGQVCFEIRVTKVKPITAAHIHEGEATVAGPVVVDFDVPSNGLSGCVEAEPDLIRDIRREPDMYYVNVHNAPYPDGALRGQLSR